MAADSPTPSEDGEPRLSWRDRELLTALRRLANSRAQVQTLEEAERAHDASTAPGPEDVARVDELEVELTRLRAKASARFGAGAARERLPDVELQLRLALERLGHPSYEAFVAAGKRPAPQPDAVDPAILDFAHRELEAAEQAYAELLSMPDEVDEAPASPRLALKRDFGDDRAEAPTDLPATIDLTGGEPG